MAAKPEERQGAQFVRFFGPLLDALRSLGDSGTPDEVIERIARDLNIPDEIQNELMTSGEPRFRNQVHFARFYLVKEGLIDSSRRGVWSLTELGRKTHLTQDQARQIFLKIVKFYQDQRKSRVLKKTAEPEALSEDARPPDPDYRAELLAVIQKLSASGFERLSQRILRESGFTQVEVTGRSGDGGIDGYGTLQLNPLVSFRVLFQCKKYQGSVTPSQVRDFRGAMAGRADKGIVITTGSFTAEARREASRDGVPPIELIDGMKLIQMLEKLELGLKPVQTFEVDLGFFEEFQS